MGLGSNEKLDKDRFRRDMGSVEEAYQEIIKRLTGEIISISQNKKADCEVGFLLYNYDKINAA